jgi:hypothetical protein
MTNSIFRKSIKIRISGTFLPPPPSKTSKKFFLPRCKGPNHAQKPLYEKEKQPFHKHLKTHLKLI